MGIVFTVEDVGRVVTHLRERDVKVTGPRDISAGLEALFKDSEGNIYHVF